MLRTRRRSSSGGPVAAYAGILDGRRLWLSVDGTPALRDASGAVHTLAGDPAGGLDLPGGEGEWDVLVDGEPVTIGPVAKGTTRVPPDGPWQCDLVRTDAGTLRVRRDRRAPGVDVLGFAVEGDGVRVTLAGEVTAVRVGDASFPVVDGSAVLTSGPTGPVRAHPGDLPLRRRANDLATPGQAVLLPGPLRWSPAGELVVR
ncbi:hypothetical protein GCM10027062_20140 [Nocardioides hungaricus]